MNDGDIQYLRKILAIPGKDGDDVSFYLEKQLAKLLAELERLRKDKDLLVHTGGEPIPEPSTLQLSLEIFIQTNRN